MDLRLADQVVFVAGSSRGIGRAIAACLLDEGARVVVTGRDEQALQAAHDALSISSSGDRILAIRGDMTDGEAIADALSRTSSTFGRIDHLVANVGSGSGQVGWDATDEEWRRLFEINFFGATRLTRAVIPHLLAQRGGSIVHMASIVAVEATAAPLPYSAAKAALVNYAKNLARQLGPQGIRVNTVAPGNVLFEGGTWERHLQNDRGAVESMLVDEVPLRRFGVPNEIATLVAWLCSPLASFATGGCYVVDGGQTRTI